MFTIDTKLNELRLAIVSNPLVVNPNERVIDAIAQMIVGEDKGARPSHLEQLHLKERSSCVLVVENGQAIGILTERDVVRLTIERQPIDRLLMHEVMSQPIVTVRAEESLNTVQQLMEQRDIHRLVVIGEQNELVGIVTQTLLLQFLNLPELVRLKAEDLIASQRAALEESNALLVRTSEDLRCTIEELRSSTEELIEKQHYLEDEQVRYHNLFIFSPDGYLVTDASGNIKEANQAILNQLAISHEFIRDKPFIVFVAPNQSEIFHSRLNHLLTSVIINANWETTLVSRQGNSFPVEITVTKNISLATKEIQFFWIVRDIRDRKHAQKALQQQLSAIEAAIDGIAILQENNYIYLNQAHLEMFGYKKSEELIGKSWTHLYAPEEIARFAREVFPVLGRDRSWQGEAIAIRKDGTTFTEGLSLTITEDNLLICVCRDISDRKQAEQIIHQQLRQQQMLEALTQQIRESLNITEILATVTQQVRDLFYGDRVIIFQLFADGRSQIVEEAVSENFPKLKSRSWENEVWAQDILDCYWQGNPRIIPDVMNDVWTDCLIEYSLEGQVKSKIVAPILQDLHGIETHQWVSPTSTKKIWGVLVIHACQDRRVWQESEAQLLQQIANQLAIAIQQASLFERLQQELAERKQAQLQLIESNQQLAISNQELARTTRHKDEFLANMSHELRTPLNAILGITEGLMDEVFGLLSEEQKRILPIIERSGNHLLELINDILDLSKIEAGKLVLDSSLTDVNRLCQSSIMFVKQQSMQKKLHLILEVAPFLPEMMIDERRIRQVLINLLNNAVKFTPDGGQITLEVMLESVNAASDGVTSENNPTHWLHFAVIDTGIGIAPEALKNLFQPFVQIDSALNRQYDGAGLGLALVKRIVELHHGYVNVTSELDIGSRFTVSLPYDSTSISLPQALPKLDSEAIASTNDSTDSSPLILLAEDNEANILTISSYLEAKGYRLIIAKNGLEAINLVLSEQPNLVLMDIQMPGMDGLEAIKRIRAQNLIDVPIVAVTALAMEGDREKCLAAGANDYLSKPIKLKQLATLIQQFV
jgi:PAS domain S-box-containing protein